MIAHDWRRLAAYALLAVAGAFGLWRVNDLAVGARERDCMNSHENRVTIRTILRIRIEATRDDSAVAPYRRLLRELPPIDC